MPSREQTCQCVRISKTDFGQNIRKARGLSNSASETSDQGCLHMCDPIRRQEVLRQFDLLRRKQQFVAALPQQSKQRQILGYMPKVSPDLPREQELHTANNLYRPECLICFHLVLVQHGTTARKKLLNYAFDL